MCINERTGSLYVFNFVLLQKVLHATSKCIRRLSGGFPDFAVFKSSGIDLYPGAFQKFLTFMEQSSLVDQCFGWNAANIEADATG